MLSTTYACTLLTHDIETGEPPFGSMADCEEALPHLPIVSACDAIQREFEFLEIQVTEPAYLRYSADDIPSRMLFDPPAKRQDPNHFLFFGTDCKYSAPDLMSIHSTMPQEPRNILNDFRPDMLQPWPNLRTATERPSPKKSRLEAIVRLEAVDATVHESNSAHPRQAGSVGAVALASFSRRGRGQRKNKAYWKTVVKHGEPQNPFERDCLFGSEDGPLTTPATSYMDSTSTIPCCMSMKYLHELGLESHLSAAFEDPGLLSIGMGGQKAKVTGMVRDRAFRLKGASTTFRGDFYVSELLDGFYDILFGWQFMSNEAADILEKAHKVYQDAKAFIGNAASKLTVKIGNVVSQTQRRVSDFVSGVSLPPPPYSLVNILEGDYVVAPRVL